MSNSIFVPLRAHSEFSITDGIIRVSELASHAAKLGYPALALTDLMNTFGLIKFYKACRKKGIKPIIGADIRVENPNQADDFYSVLLLAKNHQGYVRLAELLTAAYEGDGRDLHCPKVLERDLANGDNSGLICLSGAQQGEVGRHLLLDNVADARAAAQKYAAWFPNAFYLELQRLNEKPEWEQCVAGSLHLAAELDLPVVATHPIQFLQREDFKAHDARVCIAGGWVLADKKRPQNFVDSQYFVSPQEMAECFADIPEALANSLEIAKRCNVTLTLGKPVLPNFPTPNGMDLNDYLVHLSNEGLRERMAVL